jgi:hypothetical protein
MTIVVYSAKEEIMACDSAWTHSDVVVSKQTKMVRLQNGALLGDSGDADAREMRELLGAATCTRLPSAKAIRECQVNFHGIMVFRNGRVFDINTGYDKEHSAWWGSVFELKGRLFFAVGIGADFALGAMAAGATVHKAVSLTCQWIDGCRGPVLSEPLRLPRAR